MSNKEIVLAAIIVIYRFDVRNLKNRKVMFPIVKVIILAIVMTLFRRRIPLMSKDIFVSIDFQYACTYIRENHRLESE